MVAMVTEQMKTKAVSAYLWTPPIATATQLAKELRPDVDLLIALTHIGNLQDIFLAQQCPEIDIILGGHSHTVLPQPVKVRNTWIAQGGSHNRYVGMYEWADNALTGELLPVRTSNR